MQTDSSLLKSYTDTLLNNNSTWLEKRNILIDIHELFVKHGAVSTKELDVKENAIWLENGYAVSPISAAFCLFEIKRTCLFVQGLIDAIKQLLNITDKRPLRVLDAGCGPYALLSLLAAQYFTTNEVQFYLLDIHDKNFASAKLLIHAFNMKKFFAAYILADACTYKWQEKDGLDILISETMLNALRKEPQVAVTLNLAKQLENHGILIPAKIEVDFVQVDTTKQQALQFETDCTYEEYLAHCLNSEQLLANIITLTKNSTPQQILAKPIVSVVLPANYQPTHHTLQLQTTITVYNNYILQRNDTSLTLPLVVARPDKNVLPANTKLAFSYNMQGTPGIVYEKVVA